jgi:DNA-binding beta-propeller fold protein YncE
MSIAAVAVICVAAVDYRVPGANFPAQLRDNLTILPGGRVLRPYGKQVMTGTGAAAMGISPSGKTIVTANIGISLAIGLDRASITVIVPGHRDLAWSLSDFSPEPADSRNRGWKGVSTGLAVTSDGTAWLSEGNTGRVVELNLSTGTRKRTINLNTGGYEASFTGPILFDPARNLLFVLDQANGRGAIVDAKRLSVLASVKTGASPSALALSSDGQKLYVASEASLAIVDVSDPAAPKPSHSVPLPSEPGGIAVHGDEIYVSLPHDDSIAIVDGTAASVSGTIPLRIPGLEALRGVTPAGLAFEPKSGRLLVAEAGINATGIIDPASRKVLGHLPAGWFPCSIQTHDGQIYVANMQGLGSGPSDPSHRLRAYGGRQQDLLPVELLPWVLRRGTVSAFTLPDDGELTRQTGIVMEDNGFERLPEVAKRTPPVRYVVVIAKGNRSFDEVLGDIDHAGDHRVFSEPAFARYGQNGYVGGDKKQFSLNVNVTPNHHEIAARWSFSDNYYASADYMASGDRWLKGAEPDFRSATRFLFEEARNGPSGDPTDSRDLWTHLARHHIDYLSFDEGANDQDRASKFMAAIRSNYVETGKPLPRFLFVTLPGDSALRSRPEDGHPYDASFVADNDYALGRMIEFLSHTSWWREMAIFVTETGAEAGADHIDSHRTFLLGAGPWFRNHYVSHTNSGFPSLLRTVFHLLDLPPLNLYDATASDLSDMFANVPDFTPYEVQPEDMRLFDPDKAR